MTVPFYPWTVWIWAGFDPALIVVALYLGWTASQFGKVFIAAIAALGFSVLFSYAVSAAGMIAVMSGLFLGLAAVAGPRRHRASGAPA